LAGRLRFIASLRRYVLAKAFEVRDRRIFALGAIVSGHSLKHIVAAFSAYWILRMFRLRTTALPSAAA
jgi:hypothetical protein